MTDIITAQEGLGILAAVIGIAANVPYMIATVKGQIRPHVFSWAVFALMMAIMFGAQISEGSGAGAWVTGVSAVMSLGNAMLAIRYGEKRITRSDWIAFGGALASIPLWFATDNPLYAMILLIVIDSFAMWPTMRKSWAKPFEESLQLYAWCVLKYALTLPAIQDVNVITVTYPAFLLVWNIAFVGFLIWRRQVVRVPARVQHTSITSFI